MQIWSVSWFDELETWRPAMFDVDLLAQTVFTVRFLVSINLSTDWTLLSGLSTADLKLRCLPGKKRKSLVRQLLDNRATFLIAWMFLATIGLWPLPYSSVNQTKVLQMGGKAGQCSQPAAVLTRFPMILCCMCSSDPWFACVLYFEILFRRRFVFTTLTTCRVVCFVFHAHCFFFPPPFFLLFFFKRVCPLCWVWNTHLPPLPCACLCLYCHFLSSAGVWAAESKGDHSGSARQLDSGSRCGVLFTSSPPQTRSLLPLSVTHLILVPLLELGPGALGDYDSNAASQFLRERNSLSGEEKPQVESWSSGEESPRSLLVTISEVKKSLPFDLFIVTQLHLSCLLQEPIRPLEKRALNFLVNEYLLKNEYKLSSITFSDENDDQVNLSLFIRLG